MTKEYVLLVVAGALIAAGLFVIAGAIQRAKRREEARARVTALLSLVADPATLEPDPVPDESWDHAFRDEPVVQPRTIAPAAVPRTIAPAPAPRAVPATPHPAPRRAAGRAHQFVFTLSDSSGSFVLRSGSDR